MATFYGTEAADLVDYNDVSAGVTSDPPGLATVTADGDLIFGYGGWDTLHGGLGHDTVYGGEGNDRLTGEVLYGEAGNDTLRLYATEGPAIAYGGAGQDSMFGPSGTSINATLYGGLGNDGVRGGSGDDFVSGDGGDDHVDGQDGSDVLRGGNGNDQLRGDGYLVPSGADDTLIGGYGDDLLDGGLGDDFLNGGVGADLIEGFEGADTLIGDAGDDVFRFGVYFNIDADAFTGPPSTPEAFDLIRAGYLTNVPAFEGAGVTGGDVIDVAGLDADEGVDGDQAFIFGGRGAGHLWLAENGARTLVYANTDTDAALEFKLAIDDGAVRASEYTAVDFIL